MRTFDLKLNLKIEKKEKKKEKFAQWLFICRGEREEERRKWGERRLFMDDKLLQKVGFVGKA